MSKGIQNDRSKIIPLDQRRDTPCFQRRVLPCHGLLCLSFGQTQHLKIKRSLIEHQHIAQKQFKKQKNLVLMNELDKIQLLAFTSSSS